MPTSKNSYTYRRKQNAGMPTVYDPTVAGWGYIPNFTIGGTASAGTGTGAGAGASTAGAAGTASGGLKGAFAGWKQKAAGLGDKAAAYIDPNAYNWTKSSGLKFTNPNTGKVTNLGKWGNVASLAMHGIDAAKGISDYNEAVSNNEDLMTRIRASAMSNPLLSSYLTSDQMNMLNSIRTGSYNASDAGVDTFLQGAAGGLGDAALGAVMGIPGGLPGIIIGAAGGLINAGIDNQSQIAGQNSAELQALYQALQDAEMQYRSMKRPNFTGLGIQQQYQNMYA